MASASTSASESNALINTDPKFQIQLANMAYADSLHDFGHAGFHFDTTSKKVFDNGLPVPPNAKWDEDKTLKSVILNLELGNANRETPLPFDVGYDGKPLFNYLAKSYQMESETDDPDFGKNFVETMELGGAGRAAAFVLDFNQHGFLDKLKRGKSAEGFEVFYITTPEVVNDPANKPNVSSDLLFGANNANAGVKMVSYVSEEKNHVHYLKFKPDYEHTNLFFSKFDFRLSPIKTIITKQKAEKLITTLNISQPDRPNLVANIEDSKGENSINTLVGYLKKLVATLLGKGKESSEFNFNTKIQQKRAGDWLQALTCLDVRNRVYKEMLPNPGSGRKLPANCPVYFVTHDRIAVAYALLMGVNVIYLDFYKKIFVFKNTADPTVKSSGKPLEEIILENIQNKWITTGALDELKITGQGYTNIKTSSVERAYATFRGRCTELTNALNAIVPVKDKIANYLANYQDTVKKGLIQCCVEAVRYAFYENTLIDIADEMKLLDNMDTSNGDAIMALNRAINTVNSIQEKFGKMAINDNAMASGIEWWIGANVTKLDVYKTAAHIFDSDVKNEVSFEEATKLLEDRLMEVVDKTGQQRQTDKHMFLAYLQHSIPDDKRKPFMDMISVLTDKTKEYFQIVSPSKVVHMLRGGRIAPNVMFYNIIANLIYEVHIFLGSTSNIEENDIVILESEGNVMMKADMADVSLFMGTEGKSSNDTTHANDFSLKGGGDYKIFDAAERQKPGLINDMGNRQMVWPLLTNTMLSELSKLTSDIDEGAEGTPITYDIEEVDTAAAATTTSSPGKEDGTAAAATTTSSPGNKAGGAPKYWYLPLYMIASAAIVSHNPAKLSSHPDKDNFFKYYGFVRTLFETGSSQFTNHLYVFFFASNTSNLILSELKSVCPTWILLLNDSYCNYFMGRLLLTPAEEKKYKDLVAEPAFKQYLKDCLLRSDKASVEQLYGTIVSKVVTKVTVKSIRKRRGTKHKKSKKQMVKGNKQSRRVLRAIPV